MLFERRCPGCGTPASGSCSPCLLRLGASGPGQAALERCAGGLALDDLVALWTYGPTARALVLAAKNGRRRDLYRTWAGLLAVEVRIVPDLVTWVPANRARRRRRGYDQGQVLAQRVASALGVACRSMLVRRPEGAAQPRCLLERIEGPRLAATRRCPRRVLVIDDVLTTGGSLAAAAAALRTAGAEEVTAAVLAVVVVRGDVGVVGRLTGGAGSHVRGAPGGRYG